MPIKPENLARYPANWKSEIRPAILERACHCCEGSPDFPDCRAKNYEPHPNTGSKVVLTIAHLDHTPEHCDHSNLKAWCQRYHLNYDKDEHAKNAAQGRRDKSPQNDLVDQLEKAADDTIRRGMGIVEITLTEGMIKAERIPPMEIFNDPEPEIKL